MSEGCSSDQDPNLNYSAQEYDKALEDARKVIELNPVWAKVCMRACVRGCVRACVRACVVYIHACPCPRCHPRAKAPTSLSVLDTGLPLTRLFARYSGTSPFACFLLTWPVCVRARACVCAFVACLRVSIYGGVHAWAERCTTVSWCLVLVVRVLVEPFSILGRPQLVTGWSWW